MPVEFVKDNLNQDDLKNLGKLTKEYGFGDNALVVSSGEIKDVVVDNDLIIKIKNVYLHHKEAMERTVQAMNDALVSGIQLGGLLLSVKEELPHGDFQKWIEEQGFGFSYRTARRYMLLSEKQQELESVGISSLGDAYRFINSKSDTVSLLKTETVSLLSADQEEQFSPLNFVEQEDEEKKELEKQVDDLTDQLEHSQKVIDKLRQEKFQEKETEQKFQHDKDVILKAAKYIAEKEPDLSIEVCLDEASEILLNIKKIENNFSAFAKLFSEYNINSATKEKLKSKVESLLNSMSLFGGAVGQLFEIDWKKIR